MLWARAAVLAICKVFRMDRFGSVDCTGRMRTIARMRTIPRCSTYCIGAAHMHTIPRWLGPCALTLMFLLAEKFGDTRKAVLASFGSFLPEAAKVQKEVPKRHHPTPPTPPTCHTDMAYLVTPQLMATFRNKVSGHPHELTSVTHRSYAPYSVDCTGESTARCDHQSIARERERSHLCVVTFACGHVCGNTRRPHPTPPRVVKSCHPL